MVNIIRLILKYCGIFKITDIQDKDEQIDSARVVWILLIIIGVIIFLIIII